jgi:hypothetical protein
MPRDPSKMADLRDGRRPSFSSSFWLVVMTENFKAERNERTDVSPPSRPRCTPTSTTTMTMTTDLEVVSGKSNWQVDTSARGLTDGLSHFLSFRNGSRFSFGDKLKSNLGLLRIENLYFISSYEKRSLLGLFF